MQSARLDDPQEQEEALRILREWEPIEKLEDALPLLSIKFAANAEYNPEIKEDEKLAGVYHQIRTKALNSLKSQSVTVIKSIILQLI